MYTEMMTRRLLTSMMITSAFVTAGCGAPRPVPQEPYVEEFLDPAETITLTGCPGARGEPTILGYTPRWMRPYDASSNHVRFGVGSYEDYDQGWDASGTINRIEVRCAHVRDAHSALVFFDTNFLSGLPRLKTYAEVDAARNGEPMGLGEGAFRARVRSFIGTTEILAGDHPTAMAPAFEIFEAHTAEFTDNETTPRIAFIITVVRDMGHGSTVARAESTRLAHEQGSLQDAVNVIEAIARSLRIHQTSSRRCQ